MTENTCQPCIRLISSSNEIAVKSDENLLSMPNQNFQISTSMIIFERSSPASSLAFPCLCPNQSL